MDTDSLTYEIQTEDIYKDMLQDSEWFDTCDYPRNHPNFSTANKKVPGKMKDEMNGVPMREFCALKAKMYSILADGHGKQVAKGVAKTFVKKHLQHEDYCRVLTTGQPTRSQAYTIRSELHQIYTMLVAKRALDPNDSKRVVLQNRIDTLPFGHRKLNDLRWCQQHVLRNDDEDDDDVNSENSGGSDNSCTGSSSA
jgi:hypothetical protein